MVTEREKTPDKNNTVRCYRGRKPKSVLAFHVAEVTDQCANYQLSSKE